MDSIERLSVRISRSGRNGSTQPILVPEVYKQFASVIGKNGITAESIAILRTSNYFDAQYYLSQMMSMDDFQTDPLVHYLSEGWKRNLRPNRAFSPQWYLGRYKDIKKANLEPLSHFVQHGCTETSWRTPSPWLVGPVAMGKPPRRLGNLQARSNVDDRKAVNHPFHALFLDDRLAGHIVILDETISMSSTDWLIAQIRSEFPLDRIQLISLSKGQAMVREVAEQLDYNAYRHFNLDAIGPEELTAELREMFSLPELSSISCFAHHTVVDQAGRHLPFYTRYVPTGSGARSVRRAIAQIRESTAQVGKIPVYFLQPDWTLSGVNTFVEELCTGLLESEKYAPEIIATKRMPEKQKRQIPDVPVRYLDGGNNAQENWNKIEAQFADGRTAIVVPNYDFLASAVTPNLPACIKVLGIVHSDDAYHYEHVYRLGRYWNWIVAVSKEIEQQVCELNPSFQNRVSTIKYGIKPAVTPDEFSKSVVKRQSRLGKNGLMRIVYAGRLVEYQKCASQLPLVVRALKETNTDFVLDVLGGGESQARLEKELAPEIVAGLVRFHGRVDRNKVFEYLQSAHVSLLVSEFEGLPLTTLESIATGAVPCMYRIKSGIEEVLKDGESCVLADQKDAEQLAQGIAQLTKGKNYKKMANAAYKQFFHHQLDAPSMAQNYVELFDKIIEQGSDEFVRPKPLIWGYHAPSGRIPPPSIYRRE